MSSLQGGFQLGPTQINLCNHGRKQEACNFGFKKNRDCTTLYSKFGNFRLTFISRILYSQIISEFLNSRVSVHLFYKINSNSLNSRTLNLRGNQFAIISEN